MSFRDEVAKTINVNSKKFARMEADARNRGLDKAALYRKVGRKPNAVIQNIRRTIAILQAGVTLVVLFLVQGVGTVVALCAGIWLEIKATTNGFRWIDAENAAGYATISILLFVLLLFINASLADRHGPKHKVSIRIWWDDLLYFLGIGKDWEATTQGTTVNNIIRLWVVAIVLFGFLGRLEDVIADYQDLAFGHAVQAVFDTATFPQVVGIIGNTFYTMALALGLHFVITHIYSIYVALTGGVEATDFFSEEPYVDEEKMIQEELENLYKSILARNSTE